MTCLKMTLIAIGAVLLLPAASYAGQSTTAPQESTSALSGDASTAHAKCLKAEVNPVTGNAVCIDPVGAPVERPSVSDLKPCKKRPHDNQTGTVYEHWSSC